MDEKKAGVVVNFFAKPMVAAVRIAERPLKVGDTVRFFGHTTDFTMVVESMQVDNQPVHEAEPGDLVGIKVPERVREHDQIFLVAGEE